VKVSDAVQNTIVVPQHSMHTLADRHDVCRAPNVSRLQLRGLERSETRFNGLLGGVAETMRETP